MHVLSITTSEELVESTPDGRPNRAQARQLALAAHLDAYHIITRTLPPRHRDVRHLSDQCIVYPSNSSSRWRFIRDAYRIACEIAARDRIDVVSCRDPFLVGQLGVRLKRRFNWPLVVHIMGDMIDNPEFLRERWRHRYLNGLAYRVMACADAVRVSTQRQYEQLRALCERHRWPARVYRLPFFIDPRPFLDAKGVEIRRNLNCGKHEVLILAVGRLAPEKDFGTLIRAFERVGSTRSRLVLVIVGAGPLGSRLQAMAARVARRVARPVHLVGRQPYQTVASYYAAADIVAVTSRYEGTCMVLLEAGMSAKPAVTTDHAGAPDAILDGETGFIVRIGDAQAIADRLGRLIDDEEIRCTMGRRAREHIQKHFAMDQLVADYIRMWRDTIENATR